MIDDTLSRASELLGGAAVQLVGAPLPASSRNLVLRVSDGNTSFILKRRISVQEPSPEGSALSALTAVGSTVTPRLLASSPDLLVMADLGDHPHLASLLLGSDPLAAHNATLAWARSLGAFHRFGRAAREPFVLAAPEHLDYMPGLLDEAAADLVTRAADLGVAVRHGFSPLTGIRFRTSLDVLSAGDMCPDNNLVSRDTVAFIDLEFATARHLAWDLSYLFAPWPSCWCAWRLPDALVDRALNQWRESFALDLDWTDLVADVALATDAWRWLAVSWLLPSLATGWPVREDRPAPAVADRIVHALDSLTSSVVLPELTETAAQLAQAVRSRVPVKELGFVRALS